VQLKAGGCVPADLRLLTSRDLKIAESALTGESVVVEKDASTILPIETVLAERVNMAYSSTLVTYGIGFGIVVATGDSTEVGMSSPSALSTSIWQPCTREASLTRSPFQIGFFTNPWAIGGALLMVLIQAAYTYLPFMNELFGSQPISAVLWLDILVVSLAAFVIIETEKWIRRRAAK
jgi:magnesium-transporting ATPase (P-type)